MPERINTHHILQSIQENEPWKNAFESVMQSGGEKVVSFLDLACGIYNDLEQEAQSLPFRDPKKAENVKSLWVISAPGTYFKAEKPDRYQHQKWSYWMDRRRINHTFRIGRQIAQIRSGETISGNTPHDLELLRKFGPTLIYNGRSDENAELIEAVKIPWLRIPEGLGYPRERVLIINPLTEETFHTDKYNLLAQVRTLRLPEGLQPDTDDEMGIVAHSAQAVRALFALAKRDPSLPVILKARVFPLATPEGGFPEYPTQELRAMVFYRFIANPPLISDLPHPFSI